MTLLLETELMRSAVAGKLGGWETLRENAPELHLDAAVYDRLIEAGHRQLATLDEIHEYTRTRALRDNRHSYWT